MDRDTALTLAMRSYLAGRLGPAEEACQELLIAYPKDGSAHHLMGLIAFADGRADEAIGHLVTAASLLPGSAEIRSNLGLAFRVAGRPDAAAEQFARALSLKPNDPALMGELALTLMDLGRTEEALDTLRAAIVTAPKAAALRNSLGNAYRRLHRLDDARRELTKALELFPGMTEAHLNMGILMRETGEIDESIAFLTEAARLSPDNAEIAVQLGMSLKARGRREEAMLCFEKAVAADPEHADARNDLGVALIEHDRPEDAEPHLRKAIALQPAFLEAYANLAAALIDRGEAEAAIKVCEAALARDPNHADCHWHKALALLTIGDLEKGFEEYGWRWTQDRFVNQRMDDSAPMWRGEALADKRIVVWSEQGFGDAVQFARLAPELARRGARVVFEVRPQIAALMSSLDGVESVTRRGDPRPEHDFQVALLDLPHLLRLTSPTTIPAPSPYLRAAPERAQAWRDRLAADTSPIKVGIAWRGSPTNSMDKRRSCPAAWFLMLTDITGVTLYSLQKDAVADYPADAPIVDLGPELTDFSETAAAMTALDLIVTVDTAIAHVAGALGRPVWTLLAYAPDWRWGLTGKATPWYPTMALYRQPTPRDWNAVFKAVRDDLVALAAPMIDDAQKSGAPPEGDAPPPV